MMLETQSIAETFGVKFRVDVERRIEGACKVGAHKTSMLQDLERGRPMEIDPLVNVVQEMGRLTQIRDTSYRRGSGARNTARQNRWSLLNSAERRIYHWNGGWASSILGVFIVTYWVRFRHLDTTGFGTISQSEISVHDGEMFGESRANGRLLALGDFELLAPSEPSKIIALWNNFHALAAKLNVREPDEPLYLLKAPTTATAPNAVVRRPTSYDGKVVYA